MSNQDNLNRAKALNRCVAQLSEFFDHVQVMCSFEQDSNTVVLTQGFGNWCARLGMAHAMCEDDKANRLAAAINSSQPPDDEEEDQEPVEA